MLHAVVVYTYVECGNTLNLIALAPPPLASPGVAGLCGIQYLYTLHLNLNKNAVFVRGDFALPFLAVHMKQETFFHSLIWYKKTQITVMVGVVELSFGFS